ncbi:recombinase family protein [Mycobacterium avium]|uniref:recombinase family protein n=1 Tax=Mycobacterium avium TaxID=1764 RepID=UPI001CC3E82D|nr:recombinase family protein [Mycobacterium avium]MBZ4580998.1 recombinase family protein [Mycobacterium avium subsp. hominissuis]MBZ4608921.1 recombinase family protein [Mycobacterium avium subsp. hominissuis]
MDPTALRAAIYLRISEDRRDGAGVERQEKECRELAERLDWPIVVPPFIDNDISAFSGKRRPRYHDLLDAITSGQINAVLTWHTDRMHRQPGEQDHYIRLCQKHGVQNAAVQVGRVDLDTASGEFNVRVLGLVAHFESRHKAERIQSAHRQIAERGGWKGGIRPFGYEPDGLTVREAEAVEIKRIANAVVRGQSLRSLALELNERGVTTVTGKRWTSAHLRSMLVRSRLAGLREHRGVIVGTAAWPAILDRATWEAMKAVLEDPARCTGGGGRRGRMPTSLGTGLYLCGTCGQPRMRLGRSNGRRPIYKCGASMDDAERGHVTRAAEPLDALVEGALLEKLSEPGAIDALCAVIDTDDAELAALSREQATIRPRLKKAAKLYATGAIDDEQLADISKELRQRDSEITAALTAAAMRSPLDVLLGADDIETIWDTELTMGQKRAILAEVLTVTILPSPGGGRHAGGVYFNADAVDIALTDKARARLSA